MCAVGLRQSCETSSVQVDAVDVGADRAPFAGREVQNTGVLIYSVERTNVPASGGDLIHHCAVRANPVEVLEPASLAEPQKRAVLQPHRVTVVVHPGLCGLTKELA